MFLGQSGDELVFYADRFLSATVAPTISSTYLMPPVCSEEETWNGKRCISYCDVVEFCPEGRARKFDAELSKK